MISREVINTIKSSTDILSLVSEYVQLHKRGERYWGLSPFKREKTPSFCVTPSRNMYYCFSTQQGGDVISFVMEMEKLPYTEAVEFLAKRLGISITYQKNQKNDQEQQNNHAYKTLLDKLTHTFHYFLLSSAQGEEAREYLRTRGVSDEEIKNFMIGYHPQDPRWLFEFLQSKGYSKEFLEGSKLFSSKSHSYALFAHRVIFPIRTQFGEVIGFGGRAFHDGQAKYINSPDSKLFHKRENLFGLSIAKNAIKADNSFILCEGYFDVIAFHQAGIQNAVAPLGTAFTPEQAILLKRFASTGIIAFDGDTAGRDAAIKAAIIMEELEIECRIAVLEANKDPAEILQTKGRQELKSLVSLSKSTLDFLLEQSIAKFDIYSPSGKQGIVKFIAPYVNAIHSQIAREASIAIIADTIGISAFAVQDLISKYRTRHKEQEETIQDSSKKEKVANALEFSFLVALIINPEYYKKIRLQFQTGRLQLSDTWSQTILAVLEEHFRNDSLNFFDIVQSINIPELKSEILRRASSEEYDDNITEFLESSSQRLVQEQYQQKQLENNVKIRLAERQKNQKELQELLIEREHINSMIHN